MGCSPSGEWSCWGVVLLESGPGGKRFWWGVVLVGSNPGGELS